MHLHLNDRIRTLYLSLKHSGMDITLKEKTKKNGNPPLISITSILEANACKSIAVFFSDDLGKRTVERLSILNINPDTTTQKDDTAKPSSTSAISGKSFVLTGSLPTLSRDQASELIRHAGGSVTGSVSKNTDFLLAGESAGSKLDRARELNVRALSENEFLELLGKRKPMKPGAAQGSLFE